jgi:uncharacterized membrane protein YciS (DUF1049 family)
LTIYEISEAELEVIERGAPDSPFITLSAFLLSAAISFSIALATTTITSPLISNAFAIVTTVGYLGGLFCLFFWLRNQRTTRSVTRKIRERLLPEGEQIQD